MKDMGFGDIREGIEVFFMIVGLLIVLPPILTYRFIKFLGK
jgi:hypothetical protein